MALRLQFLLWGEFRYRRGVDNSAARYNGKESAAPPYCTFNPDSTAHPRHQPTGNGQPQTRTPMAPRSRIIGLGKNIKNLLVLALRNPNPRILDLNTQLNILLVNIFHAGPKDHLSNIGKLDRVIREVERNLGQPCGVP